MLCRTTRLFRGSRNCVGGAVSGWLNSLGHITTPKRMCAVAATGYALVCDLLGSELEQIRSDTADGNLKQMETATKAQQELEKIEKQIAQLEPLGRDNEDAHKQLQALHNQVNVLRKQINQN